MPPRGATVEKDRLIFYISRQQLRWEMDTPGNIADVVLEEETETKFKAPDWASWHSTINNRAPLKHHKRTALFNKLGNLRFDVFERAYFKSNPTSSPGFPLGLYFDENKEAHLRGDETSLLYKCVSDFFKKIDAITMEDLIKEDAYELLREGLLFVAHTFVKGEPTGVHKVARLIYGCSLVKSVIDRIVFGDYIENLPNEWDRAEHKVGMDMYTEEGRQRLFRQYSFMYDKCVASGFDCMASNDISGYEYSCTQENCLMWHSAVATSGCANCSCDSCRCDPLESRLEDNYAYMVGAEKGEDSDALVENCWFADLILKMGVVDARSLFIQTSDGELLYLDNVFLRFSGLLKTHIQNSDERSAMAYSAMDDTARGHDAYEAERAAGSVLNMTNGDDCIEPHMQIDTLEDVQVTYDRFHVKITDLVIQTRNRMDFSSNVFVKLPDGRVERYPANIGKMLFGCLVEPNNDVSVLGVLANIQGHPGWRSFLKIVNRFRDVPINVV